MCAFIYAWIVYVCVHVYVSECVYVYVCMCVSECVYVYVCMCVSEHQHHTFMI